jgi:hypothetical protein
VNAPRRRTGLSFLLVTALIAMLAVFLPAPVPPASAADLGAFEAGNIISDPIFYDAGTLDATAVQSFLNNKGRSCTGTSTGTCLKDFRQATTTQLANSRCTRTYEGVSDESAAQIIAKVGVACGINPEVLIVTLQKEQGLITATTGRSAAVYQKALGFGCPDTAACDAQYYGFFNQIYRAAWQFRSYALNPSSYAHRAGITNQVRFSPDANCGTSPVFIQNQATASLYNYTPYQPNAAALAAGYGSGNTCSAYGNRNFWNYFTDWFGSTTQRPPFGSLDAVASTAGTVTVSGWALDPDTTTPIGVHVYVDGVFATNFTADGTRTDVGVFGKGSQHGFDATFGAASGRHEVCAWAIDSAGGPNPKIGCRSVTVTNAAPIGAFDTVGSALGRVTVAGWALDPDTNAATQARVEIDGAVAGSLVADDSRTDVGALFGKGDSHGFGGDFPASAGQRNVCLFSVDSVGGPSTSLGCKSVDVKNASPVGALDSVTSQMDSFSVAGWALDPDTSNPIRVDTYVDGVFKTAAVADGSRTDVGRLYGRGDLHGFTWKLPATSGPHQVCVYPIDTWDGPNPRLPCRTVDVNGTAFGSLDGVTGGTRSVTVRGWAIDPNTTSPIAVHVYVDAVGTALTADVSRPDVESVFGSGALHGFDGTVPAEPGVRNVCVYAIDSGGGTNPRLNCKTVTVN